METNRLIEGDSLDVLPDLPENSVHAVVTDPPYGLAFMGNSWDEFSPQEYQEFSERWTTEALRVLKPGGHLVAFSGDKTHHRLFAGVEDAGYEIRHTINWLYGNGMPKGARVSRWMDDEDAEEWEGFHTELKPAAEYAVLARKPFSESTYQNVLEYGTGALNINETRIGTEVFTRREGQTYPDRTNRPDRKTKERTDNVLDRHKGHDRREGEEYEGRFTPQVALDAEAARQLDEQVGDLPASGRYPGADAGAEDEALYGNSRTGGTGDSDTLDGGGPSRFYYCSKASKSERTMNGRVENTHPTVKPLDLMEWLVRLVSAESQVVLDPFAGSGTTGLAALSSGREYILIERDEDYIEIARDRIENSAELLQETLTDK